MGMTPAYQKTLSAKSPHSLISWSGMALVLGCTALGVYAASIHAKSFEDEYAYISQSYYADVFRRGAFDHPVWLDFCAYDIQPLPKYLIGLSLRSADLPVPDARAARDWYLSYAHFGTSATLTAARWPSVILGALGCIAIFGCGTLIKDAATGAIAAILVMLNPLYRLHAHRAMSDVPCEAFVAISLALALLAWKWAWGTRGLLAFAVMSGFAGMAAGLGLLCKFNAFLGLFVVAAWTAIGIVAPGLRWPRRLLIVSSALTILAAASLVFVMLNPFLTARPPGPLSPEARQIAPLGPWQRFLFQVRHRVALAKYQQDTFPHDALHTLAGRCQVVAIQGFGRFGLFGPSSADSRVRYDLGQDRGAPLWAAFVLIGLVKSLGLGMRQWRAAQPPTGFALFAWAAVAWLVVTVYLPMAWDRYLLPIQAANAVLAAAGATTLWDRLRPIASTLRARA
jgi:4-amino-4-deoxy-L-arabinose transferase-like glycosyltransferase